MERHSKGWLIGGVCFGYGILRTGEWIEGDIILDILAVVGFCYGIYLTRFSIKEDD